MVVARELAKRYADQGILSISVNPGDWLHVDFVLVMVRQPHSNACR